MSEEKILEENLNDSKVENNKQKKNPVRKLVKKTTSSEEIVLKQDKKEDDEVNNTQSHIAKRNLNRQITPKSNINSSNELRNASGTRKSSVATVFEIKTPFKQKNFDQKEHDLNQNKNPYNLSDEIVKILSKFFIRNRSKSKDKYKNLTEYFPHKYIHKITEPFQVSNMIADEISGHCKIVVSGGGVTGQACALSMAISRWIISKKPELPELKKTMKDAGLLTRDDRMVESKKPGKPKARKSSTYSKR